MQPLMRDIVVGSNNSSTHRLYRIKKVRSVTFGFLRNPDVARNGGSEGRKRVRPIAIDYCTVTGTAGAECKGD